MNTDAPNPGHRYQALLQLLRTVDTLWNASRLFFAAWNLSPSQFNVLNLLHGLPGGCPQAELGRQLLMHRSNVTGLVDRLEARGLVRRQKSSTDRRISNVLLTPAGERLVRKILPRYHRAAGEVWGGLSERRARQLVSELTEVSRNANQMAEHLSSSRTSANKEAGAK